METPGELSELLQQIDRYIRSKHRLRRDVDDISQCALMGAIIAARDWKPGRKATLKSYCYQKAIWAVGDYFRLMDGDDRSANGQYRRAAHHVPVVDSDWTAAATEFNSVDLLPTCWRGAIAIRLLRSLPARKQNMVYRHIIAGETVRAIALDYGVSGARISQEIHTALALLHRLAAKAEAGGPPELLE